MPQLRDKFLVGGTIVEKTAFKKTLCDLGLNASCFVELDGKTYLLINNTKFTAISLKKSGDWYELYYGLINIATTKLNDSDSYGMTVNQKAVSNLTNGCLNEKKDKIIVSINKTRTKLDSCMYSRPKPTSAYELHYDSGAKERVEVTTHIDNYSDASDNDSKDIQKYNLLEAYLINQEKMITFEKNYGANILAQHRRKHGLFYQNQDVRIVPARANLNVLKRTSSLIDLGSKVYGHS